MHCFYLCDTVKAALDTYFISPYYNSSVIKQYTFLYFSIGWLFSSAVANGSIYSIGGKGYDYDWVFIYGKMLADLLQGQGQQ